MRYAHGGVGGVDTLAARAACMVHVDANVIGANLDIDIVGQHRNDLDAGKRSLAALLVVGGANAHQAVNTGLGTKHAKGILAFDGKGRAIDADNLGRGQSLMVTFQPRRWQYFMYILKSMKVQSWASKPPCRA